MYCSCSKRKILFAVDGKNRMEATAAFQKRCLQINEEFKPKYLNAHGEEVEMKKGDAKLELFSGEDYALF